jgi:hypothetical protein
MMGRLGAVLLAASLLSGCSGLKSYPDTAPKNMLIRTETSSGSWFSNVRAAVHVHRVDGNCQTEYQGTVELGVPAVEVGLPVDRVSLLAFVFISSATLGGSSSSTRVEALLKPRAGHTYQASVSYVDSMYNVVLRETDPRRSSSRELERRSTKGFCSLPNANRISARAGLESLRVREPREAYSRRINAQIH